VRSTGRPATPGGLRVAGIPRRHSLTFRSAVGQYRVAVGRHRLKGCGVVPHPFSSLVARERLVLAVVRGRDQSTWAEEQQHTDSNQKQ
jgi:hypothetical protein